MENVQLGSIDYLILAIYVGFVVGIGFTLRKYLKSSSDFLTSGRSIPAWVTGLAFISAHLRALNSVAFAVMTVFASGISMNALAKLLNQLLGWNYHLALWICSAVVLVYVLKGGLTSAIYTEVLQFFMIVLGFAPVVYLGLRDVGGWGAMNSSLQTVAQDPAAFNLGTKA